MRYRDESLGMSLEFRNPSTALFVIPLRNNLEITDVSLAVHDVIPVLSCKLSLSAEISDVTPLTTRCYPRGILNNASFTAVISSTTRCYPSITLFFIPLSN